MSNSCLWRIRKSSAIAGSSALQGGEEVTTDISDRKRADESMRQSDILREFQRLMSDIIKSLPDPTFVIDMDGRVIAWNRAMEAFTSVLADKILGKGDYEYAILFWGERRPVLIDLVLKPNGDIEKSYVRVERRSDTVLGEVHLHFMRQEKMRKRLSG